MGGFRDMGTMMSYVVMDHNVSSSYIRLVWQHVIPFSELKSFGVWGMAKKEK